ncbi:MAG TPA: M14 family metallopeptidase, partial [Vicinamibacteria bacterium]
DAQSAPRKTASREAILPPELPWSGKSRDLVRPASDPWATPAEQSGLTATPRYEETVAWLRRLVAASSVLDMVSLGKSPEGRDLWLVIASKERAFTPEALRAAGKPTLFAQAAIHAGEVDGKDAGMMLLRDLTVGGTKRALLDRANFLFVPIFNVDGHERFSAFTRINQRGPKEAGYRTTARNLNLNRDYAKLDAPEMRHLVRALNTWPVDLYYDLHVTDDTDHQYDMTYGHNWPTAWSPSIAGWLENTLLPGTDALLRAQGHIPGRFVQLVDHDDPAQGLLPWFANPRFSNGWGDARHLPTILVEAHSLKPFAQRVLANYVLLASTLEILGERGAELRRAVREDQDRRPAELVLDWEAPKAPTRTLEVPGVEWRIVPSALSGGTRIEYTGKPRTWTAPKYDRTVPVTTVKRPRAYWVPPAWSDVIERLELQGLRVERQNEHHLVAVEMTRIREPKLASQPFEGRVGVSARFESERHAQVFPPGTVRVPTDQPLGDLLMLLLEPASPDSFFAWGFFHEVLQPTEYFEAYVLEPMAERMLAEDPALRAEFEKRLKEDPAFRAGPGAKGSPQEAFLPSSTARLQWLYERTPFYDERAFLYPIGREMP